MMNFNHLHCIVDNLKIVFLSFLYLSMSITCKLLLPQQSAFSNRRTIILVSRSQLLDIYPRRLFHSSTQEKKINSDSLAYYGLLCLKLIDSMRVWLLSATLL